MWNLRRLLDAFAYVVMALSFLVVVLALSGCESLPPCANGDWPASAVLDAESERIAEQEYVNLLRFYSPEERETWQLFASEFPQFGVVFFNVGETLQVRRGGDISNRTVLVQRRADSFWTVWEEVGCL